MQLARIGKFGLAIFGGGGQAVRASCNLELLGQFVTKQVEAGCSIAPRANFSSHTNGLQQERPISGKKCSFLHLGIEATNTDCEVIFREFISTITMANNNPE